MAKAKKAAVTEEAEGLLEGVLDAVVGPAPPRPAAPPAPAESVPAIGSDDWTAFVLSKLTPDELYDGCPTYEGLRRVCYDLLGTVVGVDVDPRQTPNAANGNHSCVVVRMTIEHPPHYAWLGDVAGRTITYSHVGDVFLGNHPDKGSKDLFAWRFSSSTCATRTKASLLRDAFRLKHVYAREELTAVKAEDSGADGYAIDTQFRGMDMICRKAGVNAARYIRHCWGHLRKGDDTADLRRLPYPTAQRVLQEIQAWAQDRSKIKDEFKGYDKNWLSEVSEVARAAA